MAKAPMLWSRVVEGGERESHYRGCLTEDAYRSLDCAATILRCAGLFGPGRLILPGVLAKGVAVEEENPVPELRDVVRAGS